ncbi:MAG: plasma membrane fusion protein prm1 [Ramalina farinacea]|uniref:Plasma membrane fusion protein PRM1 n=1 Tax=Ramalina farinacea TaxID=258253 RepID=A0AA43QUA8_9LECA|nr:plasma membrane fusion protein prm1 [Ramalina farinacea]
MSSTGEHHPNPFPAVPPSLSAGDHGMRDYYETAQDNVQRPRPNTVQNITPYLGLRSRLSQVWINRWTVLLFLVLVRVLIAIAGLNHDLGCAKSEAMSACSGVESMGSAMASMPHYLSAGVNELAASGIEKAVHGLMSMLLLTITGAEELVVFYINMLTSTYMCLITLAVSSSLHVALKVIEDVSDFLNKTLKDISSDIGTSVTDFSNGLNKFTSALDSVPKAFGGKGGDIPKIDLSSEQKALTGLQLPSGLDQDLTKLNNSIPTFQDVQNFTDNVIRFPFEEVKKLVNGYLTFDFNRSLFPVPQKEQLTFCSDNNAIGSFFDDLANLANDARKIFIAVLVILAIAVCIPMAYQEIRRYRKMQQRTAIVGDKTFDPMDVIYITSRPYTATAGIKASAPFGSTKRQALVRWVIAYATSAPALFVLTLGVTGLFSCLLQYLLLKAVEKEVPALANEVGAFADKVVDSLNNASASWANGTNAAILDTNNGINHDIFGWVNTTTGAVNGTLNAFIEKTTGVLNDTFGGTVLYEPITGIFECLIGLKVAAVQKGLTWVSDEAKVDFPLLPNDTFSLGAAASIAGAKPGGESDSFLANPGQDVTDKITGAVEKVTSHIADGIRVEAIVSTCVVLVWVIILLFAILRAIWLGLRSEKNRAEGGPAPNDGIPMQERPCTMLNGPAPAYEPPEPVHYARDNPFSDAHYAPAPPIGHARSSGIGENDYQDHKLGFGGLRQPAREESPTRGQRNSIYPIVEKS